MKSHFLSMACLFMGLSLMSQAPAANKFIARDFILDGEVYRITGEQRNGLCAFVLSHADNEALFDMVTLDNPNVFLIKLSQSLRTLGADDSALADDAVRQTATDLLYAARVAATPALHEASPSGRVIVRHSMVPAYCQEPREALKEFSDARHLLRDTVMKELAAMESRLVTEHVVFTDTEEEKEALAELREAERKDSLAALEARAETYLHLMQALDPVGRSNCYLNFKVDSVQLEFENGALHNIKAVGSINGVPEIFENFYPLSYTTKLSVNPPDRGYILRNVIGREKLIIYTKDLLHYDYNLLLKTENYAPVDQVVYVRPNASGRMLFKEKTSEILKVKVFTDLVGLDDDRPHGILQLEFSKPVNLLTHTLFLNEYRSPYMVLFNNIEPTFTLNKIEEDQNRLALSTFNGQRYAGYSDIMQYRQASLGFSLEVARLGLPAFQSVVSLGFDYYYHIIRFLDTTRDTFAENGMMTTVIEEDRFANLARDMGPVLTWHINPSDKYQFVLRYGARWYRFYPQDSQPVTPVPDLKNIEEGLELYAGDKSQLYHTFEFLASARLGKKEDLFFRSRYHFLDRNANQNYFQVQLGYAFYFFKQNN